tara:strand:+ start:183 stop:452 length:270 start_codon:yes stop_codon:yes gene_type:complete
MGGFVRAIRRVFSRPAPVVIQQPAPQPAPTAPQTAPATQPKTTSAMAQQATGSAYGGQTIMTGSTGVEEEANVQKTVLGGGTRKKKKKA